MPSFLTRILKPCQVTAVRSIFTSWPSKCVTCKVLISVKVCIWYLGRETSHGILERNGQVCVEIGSAAFKNSMWLKSG